MNRGQANRIGKLALGDRQITGMILHKADRPQARQQLAKDVGQARVGFAASDIEHPFPEDRGIDEGLAPEGGSDAGVTLAEVAQGIMGDEPTRQVVRVPMLLSRTSRCRLWRSGMSPAIVKETIWRLPWAVIL
jgi:hypothetical protein